MAAEHNWHPDYDEEQGRIIESCFDCGVSRECYPDMKPHYRRQPYLEPADLETLREAIAAFDKELSLVKWGAENVTSLDMAVVKRLDALRAIIAKCEAGK